MNNNKNRPYVICHIVSSVDDKIDGERFGAPELRPVLAVSNEIRADYAYDATLYGATTMAETYAAGFVSELSRIAEGFDRTDYVASTDVNRYFVSIDSKGTVSWESKYIQKKGRLRCDRGFDRRCIG